jgi:hypothetical protein
MEGLKHYFSTSSSNTLVDALYGRIPRQAAGVSVMRRSVNLVLAMCARNIYLLQNHRRSFGLPQGAKEGAGLLDALARSRCHLVQVHCLELIAHYVG